MTMCNDKILSVNNSNFIQYIPFFIVLKAKPFTKSQTNALKNKDNCCELLFTTCLITELIYKSFPQTSKLRSKVNKNSSILD